MQCEICEIKPDSETTELFDRYFEMRAKIEASMALPPHLLRPSPRVVMLPQLDLTPLLQRIINVQKE